MASIQKRNGSFRVRIKRVGQATLSKTFNNRTEAIKWAKETEAKHELGLLNDAKQKIIFKTFKEAAICYKDTHSIHKKIVRSETYRLQILIKRWGHLSIYQVDKFAILQLRDDLLRNNRSGETINHYFNTISKLYQMLINEWGLSITNPIKGIRRMPASKGRNKRLPNDIESILLSSCHKLNLHLLSSIIEFAIQTGMRRGELMGLTWDDIDLPNRKAFLHTTKNGESRQVPLTKRAIDILIDVKKYEKERVFPMTLNSLRNQFNKAKNYSQVNWESTKANPFIDLRFHDLRHEALSRLSDAGLNVIELSSISGHKTLGMLKRYTHPSHQAILNRLDNENLKRNGY